MYLPETRAGALARATGVKPPRFHSAIEALMLSTASTGETPSATSRCGREPQRSPENILHQASITQPYLSIDLVKGSYLSERDACD